MKGNVVILWCGVYLAIVGVLMAKYGPYTSNIKRIKNCNSNVTEGLLTVTAELFNTSKRRNLLRGNLTVVRPVPGLTLSVHDYFLVDGEWQLTFSINNLSCRSGLVSAMGKLFAVSFDKRTCAVPKGRYKFNNIDFDFVDHVYAMTREYGTVRRVVEVSNKRENILCLEFQFVVTPKKE